MSLIPIHILGHFADSVSHGSRCLIFVILRYILSKVRETILPNKLKQPVDLEVDNNQTPIVFYDLLHGISDRESRISNSKL